MAVADRTCSCGEPATTGGHCRPCHAAYMRGWRAAQKQGPAPLTTLDELEALPGGTVIRGLDVSGGYPDVWQQQVYREEVAWWQSPNYPEPCTSRTILRLEPAYELLWRPPES